mgnify:CR=1 FL=1
MKIWGYKINPFNKKKGFEGLISLIVEQQLSVASAKAIFNRIKKLIKPFTARKFIEVKEADLKKAGLSLQKINYCKGIANKIISGDLNLKKLEILLLHYQETVVMLFLLQENNVKDQKKTVAIIVEDINIKENVAAQTLMMMRLQII